MKPCVYGIRPSLHRRSEYHEDFGPVLWFEGDFCDSHEPPTVGGLEGHLLEFWCPLPDFTKMVKFVEDHAQCCDCHQWFKLTSAMKERCHDGCPACEKKVAKLRAARGGVDKKLRGGVQ